MKVQTVGPGEDPDTLTTNEIEQFNLDPCQIISQCLQIQKRIKIVSFYISQYIIYMSGFWTPEPGTHFGISFSACKIAQPS